MPSPMHLRQNRVPTGHFGEEESDASSARRYTGPRSTRPAVTPPPVVEYNPNLPRATFPSVLPDEAASREHRRRVTTAVGNDTSEQQVHGFRQAHHFQQAQNPQQASQQASQKDGALTRPQRTDISKQQVHSLQQVGQQASQVEGASTRLQRTQRVSFAEENVKRKADAAPKSSNSKGKEREPDADTQRPRDASLSKVRKPAPFKTKPSKRRLRTQSHTQNGPSITQDNIDPTAYQEWKAQWWSSSDEARFLKELESEDGETDMPRHFIGQEPITWDDLLPHVRIEIINEMSLRGDSNEHIVQSLGLSLEQERAILELGQAHNERISAENREMRDLVLQIDRKLKKTKEANKYVHPRLLGREGLKDWIEDLLDLKLPNNGLSMQTTLPQSGYGKVVDRKLHEIRTIYGGPECTTSRSDIKKARSWLRGRGLDPSLAGKWRNTAKIPDVEPDLVEEPDMSHSRSGLEPPTHVFARPKPVTQHEPRHGPAPSVGRDLTYEATPQPAAAMPAMDSSAFAWDAVYAPQAIAKQPAVLSMENLHSSNDVNTPYYQQRQERQLHISSQVSDYLSSASGAPSPALQQFQAQGRANLPLLKNLAPTAAMTPMMQSASMSSTRMPSTFTSGTVMPSPSVSSQLMPSTFMSNTEMPTASMYSTVTPSTPMSSSMMPGNFMSNAMMPSSSMSSTMMPNTFISDALMPNTSMSSMMMPDTAMPSMAAQSAHHRRNKRVARFDLEDEEFPIPTTEAPAVTTKRPKLTRSNLADNTGASPSGRARTRSLGSNPESVGSSGREQRSASARSLPRRFSNPNMAIGATGYSHIDEELPPRPFSRRNSGSGRSVSSQNSNAASWESGSLNSAYPDPEEFGSFFDNLAFQYQPEQQPAQTGMAAQMSIAEQISMAPQMSMAPPGYIQANTAQSTAYPSFNTSGSNRTTQTSISSTASTANGMTQEGAKKKRGRPRKEESAPTAPYVRKK